MNYLEIQPSAEVAPETYELMTELFANSQSEREFVQEWLKVDSASIEMTSGLDDDGRHTCFCLIPSVARKTVAEIYISRESVTSNYPSVVRISDYVIGATTIGLRLDDKRRDECESRLNIMFDDDLCERRGSFESVYEYAMSYFVDGLGSVTFGPADKDVLFEDCEVSDKSLLEDPLYVCHLQYREEKPRKGMLWGFDESLYCAGPA